MPQDKMKSHLFSPEILRAYDIRGHYGHSLSEADAYAIGRSFASYLVRDCCWEERKGKPSRFPVSIGVNAGISVDTYRNVKTSAHAMATQQRVGVGYDGRLSSTALADQLMVGLQDAGVDVLSLGMGPTPMTYFALHHYSLDGVIMVTGSHNPGEDNGFKIALKDRPFYGEDIQKLGHMAAQGNWERGNPRGKVIAMDPQASYKTALLQGISLKRPLKVVWDTGNGAAGFLVQELIGSLPGQHILLNGEVDGRFPAHDPDPTKPKNLAQLATAVVESQSDFGLAFDGDADRLVVLDRRGVPLSGDVLHALLVRYAMSTFGDGDDQQARAPRVVVDVKTSQVLIDAMTSWGVEPILCPTGHSFIKAKMKEVGALMAGEVSGHYFFKDRYFGFDDGLYAALRVLEMCDETGACPYQLAQDFPPTCVTPEIRLPMGEARKFALVAAVAAFLRQENKSFLDIDGVRVQEGTAWWLMRASNTEPHVVVRAEAPTVKELGDVLEAVKTLIQQVCREKGMELCDMSGLTLEGETYEAV